MMFLVRNSSEMFIKHKLNIDFGWVIQVFIIDIRPLQFIYLSYVLRR